MAALVGKCVHLCGLLYLQLIASVSFLWAAGGKSKALCGRRGNAMAAAQYIIAARVQCNGVGNGVSKIGTFIHVSLLAH